MEKNESPERNAAVRITGAETSTCVFCGDSDESQNMPVLYDGRDLCWSCMNGKAWTCTSCGLIYPADIMHEHGEAILCPFCVKKETGVILPTYQIALPALI